MKKIKLPHKHPRAIHNRQCKNELKAFNSMNTAQQINFLGNIKHKSNQACEYDLHTPGGRLAFFKLIQEARFVREETARDIKSMTNAQKVQVWDDIKRKRWFGRLKKHEKESYERAQILAQAEQIIANSS